MDFLTDWLTNWLKELLISGIMGNLEGLFDTVNAKVGEIAVQVGTRPTTRRCPASSPTLTMRAPCAAAGTGATAFERLYPTIRPTHSWRLSA